MSDAPSSDPLPEPSSSLPGGEQELEVDLAAFLPEGVVLGEETVADGTETDEAGDDVEIEETVVAVDTGDGVVVVEEIAIDTGDEVVLVSETTVDGEIVEEVVVDEVLVEPAMEAAPAVDLEALSQIERDLDAVDAAIAALDAGTYGTDPATGQRIDDALLAEDPTRLS